LAVAFLNCSFHLNAFIYGLLLCCKGTVGRCFSGQNFSQLENFFFVRKFSYKQRTKFGAGHISFGWNLGTLLKLRASVIVSLRNLQLSLKKLQFSSFHHHLSSIFVLLLLRVFILFRTVIQLFGYPASSV